MSKQITPGEEYIEIPDNIEKVLREKVEIIPASKFNTSEDFSNSNPDREFIGLSGEWAFSERYGLEYKGVGIEGDGGIDYGVLHIPTGRAYNSDVKTSPVRGCNLLMPEYIEITSDLYFQLEKRDDRIHFVGVASREMMENAEIIPKGQRGMKVDTRFIPREELHDVPPPDELTGVSVEPWREYIEDI